MLNVRPLKSDTRGLHTAGETDSLKQSSPVTKQINRQTVKTSPERRRESASRAAKIYYLKYLAFNQKIMTCKQQRSDPYTAGRKGGNGNRERAQVSYLANKISQQLLQLFRGLKEARLKEVKEGFMTMSH